MHKGVEEMECFKYVGSKINDVGKVFQRLKMFSCRVMGMNVKSMSVAEKRLNVMKMRYWRSMCGVTHW